MENMIRIYVYILLYNIFYIIYYIIIYKDAKFEFVKIKKKENYRRILLKLYFCYKRSLLFSL